MLSNTDTISNTTATFKKPSIDSIVREINDEAENKIRPSLYFGPERKKKRHHHRRSHSNEIKHKKRKLKDRNDEEISSYVDACDSDSDLSSDNVSFPETQIDAEKSQIENNLTMALKTIEAIQELCKKFLDTETECNNQDFIENLDDFLESNLRSTKYDNSLLYAPFAYEATQLKKEAAECDGRQEVCVEGYLNKHFISGIIDTGATRISEELYNSPLLSPYRRAKFQYISKTMVELGDKSVVNSSIAITLPIVIDERRYEIDFQVIPGLARSFIFGRNFCQKNRVIIDMSTNTYEFKANLNRNDNTKNFLYLVNECTLPAFTEIYPDIILGIGTDGIKDVSNPLMCTASQKIST
jgi:hypothetical protein